MDGPLVSLSELNYRRVICFNVSFMLNAFGRSTRAILYSYGWLETAGEHGRSIDRRFASGQLVFERQLTKVSESKSKRVIAWHGFESETSDATESRGVKHERTVWLPLWLPALTFAVFPLFVLIHRARNRDRVVSDPGSVEAAAE